MYPSQEMLCTQMPKCEQDERVTGQWHKQPGKDRRMQNAAGDPGWTKPRPGEEDASPESVRLHCLIRTRAESLARSRPLVWTEVLPSAQDPTQTQPHVLKSPVSKLTLSCLSELLRNKETEITVQSPDNPVSAGMIRMWPRLSPLQGKKL